MSYVKGKQGSARPHAYGSRQSRAFADKKSHRSHGKHSENVKRFYAVKLGCGESRREYGKHYSHTCQLGIERSENRFPDQKRLDGACRNIHEQQRKHKVQDSIKHELPHANGEKYVTALA